MEVAELGDVAGKTLLHLQCHIGHATLPWARAGATVTGVDFSPASLYIVDSIGINDMLEEKDCGEHIMFKGYARGRGPQWYDEEGDYAEPDAGPFPGTYETHHTAGGVVTASVTASIQVQWVHDHVGQGWQQFPSMTSYDDGWWACAALR